MTYNLSEEELIRFDNYGEMFRDALIALSNVNHEFKKFHESEVFPLKYPFENEQVFNEGKKKYLDLIKRMDATALKISRVMLFQSTETEEPPSVIVDEASSILIDIYRQRRWTKKINNNSLAPRKRPLTVEFVGNPSFLRMVEKHVTYVDKDVIIDGVTMHYAFAIEQQYRRAIATITKDVSKKRLSRWVKQNVNRFKISKDKYVLKYTKAETS